MLEILYHHAKIGGDRISSATGAEKNVEFFCMSVTLFLSRFFCHACDVTKFSNCASRGFYHYLPVAQVRHGHFYKEGIFFSQRLVLNLHILV